MATDGLYYFVSYTVCPELVCVLISLTPCVRVSLCVRLNTDRVPEVFSVFVCIID